MPRFFCEFCKNSNDDSLSVIYRTYSCEEIPPLRTLSPHSKTRCKTAGDVSCLCCVNSQLV
ncbi:unnamed protein product [Nesidiocoris tenuis]|uniref:Uncharacterized protein n=1 Tax=Nesidiocoris tenuis TaxID=355587 RepID=A0A6H5GFP1_9HEMI|nr:unnamed protein product [Nesidiocoris tenuis]